MRAQPPPWPLVVGCICIALAGALLGISLMGAGYLLGYGDCRAEERR